MIKQSDYRTLLSIYLINLNKFEQEIWNRIPFLRHPPIGGKRLAMNTGRRVEAV